ncbi:MAG TPA: TolC family protein [Alloacidobacterium sp.]|nr:TolC family protein [Alloacidobacterium sp.]
MQDSGRPLTLEQALSLAEQNNPQLRDSSAAVEQARAGIQKAKAYTNPSIEFLAGNQSARPIATPGVPGLLQHYNASQTIEIPSERRARIKASKLEFVSSEYQEKGVRLSVIAEVKHAFYDVLRRKEEVRHAKENFALVEDLRRRVSVEVNVGEKGRLELTRAEAELARARSQVNSAEIELANSQAILRAVMGAPPGTNFDPQGSLDNRVQLAPLDQLRTVVLASHPALSESKALTARSQAVAVDQRALRIPQPTFYGEYEVQPDITFYRFGVNIQLPLWDRRKGQIAEADAQIKRSEAAEKRRELEITAALERAYDQYKISDEQVESLQAGSLHEAQAAVDAARSAYKFGERGILEVLDAQRVLQGVRDDLLDAMYARESAWIDLEELGVTPVGGGL